MLIYTNRNAVSVENASLANFFPHPPRSGPNGLPHRLQMGVSYVEYPGPPLDIRHSGWDLGGGSECKPGRCMSGQEEN